MRLTLSSFTLEFIYYIHCILFLNFPLRERALNKSMMYYSNSRLLMTAEHSQSQSPIPLLQIGWLCSRYPNVWLVCSTCLTVSDTLQYWDMTGPMTGPAHDLLQQLYKHEVTTSTVGMQAVRSDAWKRTRGRVVVLACFPSCVGLVSK